MYLVASDHEKGGQENSKSTPEAHRISFREPRGSQAARGCAPSTTVGHTLGLSLASLWASSNCRSSRLLAVAGRHQEKLPQSRLRS